MRWKAIPDSHSNEGGPSGKGTIVLASVSDTCECFLSLLSSPSPTPSLWSCATLWKSSPSRQDNNHFARSLRVQANWGKADWGKAKSLARRWHNMKLHPAAKTRTTTTLHTCAQRERERERERGGSSYNGHSHADMLSLLPSASSHNPLNLLATFARVPPLAGQ